MLSAFSLLVAVLPNVHQANGRVKAIKHDQRQRKMVQNAPQLIAIKFVPLVTNVRRFDCERVINPQRDVCNGEKSDELASWLELSCGRQVGAATKSVDYERRLDEDLN